MSVELDFIPVRGKESTILTQTPREGNIYFATDTGKIYMDVKDELTGELAHLPVGGSGAAVLYAQVADIQQMGDGSYKVPYNLLENKEASPNVGDLIINLSDGKFLKVSAIEEEECYCSLIAVSGTGGGGGGDGPSSSSKESVSLTVFNRYPVLLYNSDLEYEYKVVVTDAEGQPVYGSIYPVTFTVALGRNTIYTNNIYSKEDNWSFNLGELLKSQFVSPGESYQLTLTAKYLTSNGGISESRAVCYVQVVSLTFRHPEYTFGKVYKNNEIFTLTWNVSGQLKKLSTLYVDNLKISEITTGENESKATYSFPAGSFAHGAHTIKVEVVGQIDEINTVTAPTFEQEYIFVEENNLIPVIACDLKQTSMRQYDTLNIPIVMYINDPTQSTVIFNLYENYPNVIGQNQSVANGEIYTWPYTPTTAGQKTLSIISGVSRRDLNVNVSALQLDNVSERSDYSFKFKASDFISNQAIQDWTFKVGQEDKKINFSKNFDWYNGGIPKTKEEQGQYFRIKAGNYMTIPYPLFGAEATAQGKSIKIIYKVTNCKDYDSEFLNCQWPDKIISINKDKIFTNVLSEGDRVTIGRGVEIKNNELQLTFTQTDKEFKEDNYNLFNEQFFALSTGEVYQCFFDLDDIPYYYLVEIVEGKLGLSLKAHTGELTTTSGTIISQYCEDTYMELEFDISKKDTSGNLLTPKNYIKTWMDGIPQGVIVYSGNMIFRDPNKTSIIVGSDSCDIDIYLIKIYEASLSDEDHIQNFIIDAPNSQEIVKRYDRNNILVNPTDSSDGISYAKLSLANPNCLVHLYDIEAMTKTKKDTKHVFKYQQFHNSNLPTLAADDITFKVQGTSSEKYVVAAANLDTDFEDDSGNTKFYDPQNNNTPLKEGWRMTPESIPINFTCTKVNVASCENANNALNQEWYNLFQPYQSVLRCKNQSARDTMQFTNGVIFIKDRNTVYNKNATDPKENNIFGDVDGYMDILPENRSYRFYSLGQMGNSKDNIHVFHDESNEYECCVEVNDNQEPQQWMISDKYEDSDIDDNNEYYGFRYPDKLEEVLTKEKGQDMVNGWRRLVTWMAHSNPQAKYALHKLAEEKATADEFNSLKNRYGKVYILNENQSAYIEINEYNSDIINYYTETEHIYGYTNLPLEEYHLSYDIYIEPNKIYYNYIDGEYVPVENLSVGSLMDKSNNWYEKTLKEFGSNSYTFKGYKHDEIIQKNYNPVVKGISYEYQKDFTHSDDDTGLISYTHDTYEYRLAKMVFECENYLVMDSVLYHYLFIERHSMIDNVAKNTFWSTEDCKHWNLIKDYDNDTADGNDNNGHLTVPYGSEAFDILPNGRATFNAHQSVWFNFVYGISSVCEAFYQAMETNTQCLRFIDGKTVSCWDKEAYLNAFTKWQSLIPERCWVEDYYRKYLRPYELYNITTFLSMLEGGQKKYQRKQYETYHGSYISSKYSGKEASSASLTFRTGSITTTEQQPAVIPVKLYSDCYFRTKFGSNDQKTRVKKDEIGKLTLVGKFDNATFDLYPSVLFSNVGTIEYPLEQVLPEVFNPAGGLPKLREIVIGSEGVKKGETKINNFSLGSTPLLESAHLAHITSGSGLNLSGSPQLIALDTVGSDFTDIVIADGSPTTSIKMEGPRTVTLSNLYFLEELEIKQPTNILLLKINNIDSNTKNLSFKLAERAALTNGYELLNINWELGSTIYIDNNTINILEKLISKTPEDKEKGTLLTGIIKIIDDSDGEKIYSPIDIYNKYVNASTYPKLDISFEDKDGQNILPEVQIQSEYSVLPWKRRIAKGNIANEEFFTDNNAPSGIYELQKTISTVDKVYTFQNRWEIWNTQTNTKITELTGEWPEYEVTQDIIFKPVYDKQGVPRQYTVTILNDDNSEIQNITLDYGTFLTKSILPLTPFSTLPSPSDLYKVNKFIGYKIHESLWTYEELENYKLQDDITLIAYYEETHVYLNPWDEKYFLINNDGLVRLKPKTVGAKGKITIPKSVNGITVTGLDTAAFQLGDNYSNTTLLTHLFFEPLECSIDAFGNIKYTENTNIVYLGFNTINGSGIIYIELPSSINKIHHEDCFRANKGDCVIALSDKMTMIPARLFKSYSGLIKTKDSNDNAVNLPKLTKIEANAFLNADGLSKITFNLPNVLIIDGYLGESAKEINFGNADSTNAVNITINNLSEGAKAWGATTINLYGSNAESVIEELQNYFTGSISAIPT